MEMRITATTDDRDEHEDAHDLVRESDLELHSLLDPILPTCTLSILGHLVNESDEALLVLPD